MNLTKELLETPRTANEYLSWVEAKIEEVASDEGSSAIRFGKGLSKKLVEEALPLSIFAQRHFGKTRCVKIRHVIGNQQYDAEVIDRRLQKSPFRFIEVTQAHEGENQYYRMLALERDGYVNVLGEVTKSGTKRTGINVAVANEARRPADVHVEELRRISDAIKRKLTSGAYPSRTALVVAFDDYLSIRSDDDMDSLREFIVKEFKGTIRKFRWLALVSWGRNKFLEFDLSEKCNLKNNMESNA